MYNLVLYIIHLVHVSSYVLLVLSYKLYNTMSILCSFLPQSLTVALYTS